MYQNIVGSMSDGDTQIDRSMVASGYLKSIYMSIYYIFDTGL